jgi:hypothetical protein
MTHEQEKMIFGKNSLGVALDLVAFFDEKIAQRIARYQVNVYAMGSVKNDAALISFWAGVLHHASTTKVSEDAKAVRLDRLSDFTKAAFVTLKRRSAPAVLEFVEPSETPTQVIEGALCA